MDRLTRTAALAMGHVPTKTDAGAASPASPAQSPFESGSDAPQSSGKKKNRRQKRRDSRSGSNAAADQDEEGSALLVAPAAGEEYNAPPYAPYPPPQTASLLDLPSPVAATAHATTTAAPAFDVFADSTNGALSAPSTTTTVDAPSASTDITDLLSLPLPAATPTQPESGATTAPVAATENGASVQRDEFAEVSVQRNLFTEDVARTVTPPPTPAVESIESVQAPVQSRPPPPPVPAEVSPPAATIDEIDYLLPTTPGQSAPADASPRQTNGAPHTEVKATESKTAAATTAAHKSNGSSSAHEKTPSTSTSGPAKSTATRSTTLQRTASSSGAKKLTKTPPKSMLPSPPAASAASPPPAPTSGDDLEGKVVKKKLSASEIDAAGNRLYEQAMESKRRLESKKFELDCAYTFKPQVNTKSKKMDTTDAPNRFLLLHERAKESQRKKEELREQMEKECTFKPQITTKAKKIAGTTDKPRFENLYKNAKEIQAKREEKKQELEKKEEEYSFKPKIKTTKSPVKSRPLYDAEKVKQRRLELEQKKLEAELAAKPKVIKKVKADAVDDKIFDRLYQGGQQRSERIARLKEQREAEEKASNTFQPKVSSAASSARTTKQPFHQRLYDKDHLRKVAAEREQKKIEEEKQKFSFKPQVSDVPDGVKSKGSNGSSSAGKSIFERLYQDKDRVKEKIELSEELKIQKEMEECTFRPHIDVQPASNSKSESTTPIWERLLSIDKNQIVEERERQKEQLDLQSCTFKPEIANVPGSYSPKRASSGNIFDRLSVSAGNTPVDDKKRRTSERKNVGAQGKSRSNSERMPIKAHPYAPRRVLSVGDVIKSSKLPMDSENTAAAAEKVSRPPRSAPSRLREGNNSSGFASRRSVSTSKVAQISQGTSSAIRTENSEIPSGRRVVKGKVETSTRLQSTLASSREPTSPAVALKSETKSILESYDSWAASLEEKMRNL